MLHAAAASSPTSKSTPWMGVIALVLGAGIIAFIIFTLSDLYLETLAKYPTTTDNPDASSDIVAALGAFTAPLSVIVGVFTGIVGAIFGYNQGTTGKEEAQKGEQEAKAAVKALTPLAESGQAASQQELLDIQSSFPRAFGS